ESVETKSNGWVGRKAMPVAGAAVGTRCRGNVALTVANHGDVRQDLKVEAPGTEGPAAQGGAEGSKSALERPQGVTASSMEVVQRLKKLQGREERPAEDRLRAQR